MLERKLTIVDDPHEIATVVRDGFREEDTVAVGLPVTSLARPYNHEVTVPFLNTGFQIAAEVEEVTLEPQGDQNNGHELLFQGKASVNKGLVVVAFQVGLGNSPRGLITTVSRIDYKGSRLAKLGLSSVGSAALVRPDVPLSTWLDAKLESGRTTKIAVGSKPEAGLLLEFKRIR